MALALSPLDQLRISAESSLFFFARAILGLKFFTTFHQDLCNYLMNPLRPRKLALAPRDHGKTMCVKALILHMLIQSKQSNIYFPNTAGTECRIVVAGETSEIASRIVRVCRVYIEKNPLLRQLWPHVRPGDKWTDNLVTLARSANYSEPTIEAVGTESALASRHIDALFEEDIFTFRAMMSPTLAQRVTTWHQAAEGIMDEYDNQRSWEIVTGTPWAQNDVYKHIIDQESSLSPDLLNDPEFDSIAVDPNLFDVFQRSVISNNQPLWPERFTPARIARIERRLRGTGLFELNFMCDYEASTLNEFQRSWLRYYTLGANGAIVLRDGGIAEEASRGAGFDTTAPLAASIASLMHANGHSVENLDLTTITPEARSAKSKSQSDVYSWLRSVMI